MELVLIVGALLALGVLAYFFGAESRDGFAERPHGDGAPLEAGRLLDYLLSAWRASRAAWAWPYIQVVERQERLAREMELASLEAEASAAERANGRAAGEATPEAPLGVLRRELVSGSRIVLVEREFAPEARVPSHVHSTEQAGYVLSGRLRIRLEGEEREVGPGECYLLPRGVAHSLEALSPARVLESWAA